MDLSSLQLPARRAGEQLHGPNSLLHGECPGADGGEYLRDWR